MNKNRFNATWRNSHRIPIGRIAAVVLFALCAIGSPPQIEAQLLNKLAKGLEKVNKGIEKMIGKEKTSDNNADENSEKETSNKAESSQLSSSINAATPALPTRALTQEETKQLLCVSPFVDQNTIFVVLPEDKFSEYMKCSDVIEGVFCVSANDNTKVYGDINTGELITSVKGKGISLDYTVPYDDAAYNRETFSGGAQIIEMNNPPKEGKSKFVSVISDGNVYTMPKTYGAMSRMLDGMAYESSSYGNVSNIASVNPYGGSLYTASDSRIGFMTPRYLRDGRRAVILDGWDKWGFIDDKGKVVVPGKYREVADFSGGQAWVRDESGIFLIDKSGARVSDTVLEIRSSQALNNKIISALSPEGIYRYMPEEWTTVYLDKTGKEIKRFNNAQGTPFVDGLAWVSYHSYDSDGHIDIIDKDFNVVERLDNTRGFYNTSAVLPEFKPGIGIAKNYDHDYVDLYGNKIIRADEWKHNTSRNFSDDGYAWQLFNSPMTFNAYMERDGHIAVALVRNRDDVKKIKGAMGDNKSNEDVIEIVYIIKETPPIGDPPAGKQTFEVNVNVVPPEAASVRGSGKYEYGSEVSISGTLNEGWVLGSIESSVRLKPTDQEFTYLVRGSGTITVYCLQKEDLTSPEWALQGDLNILEQQIPVYLETSSCDDYSSEYGSQTTGVFAIMMDPNQIFNGEEDVNIHMRGFCPPMLVEGVSNIDGKKYLVFTGNTIMIGQILTSSTGTLQSGAAASWINLLMAINGFNNVVSKPRTYRIEMNDINPQTSEFTLGQLEVWSPRYGWLQGGDSRIIEKRLGVMMDCWDCGWGANFFNGAKMKTANKRNDLIWAPPADFFSRPPTDFSGNTYKTMSEYQKAMRNPKRTFGSN